MNKKHLYVETGSPAEHLRFSVCGKYFTWLYRSLFKFEMTTNPKEVTCNSCKRTEEYKRAEKQQR